MHVSVLGLHSAARKGCHLAWVLTGKCAVCFSLQNKKRRGAA